MFELTFLGTSASVPLPKRGLSSAVVAHDEHRFMVDCGEGTQRQLLSSGLGFRRMNHILITHPHLDHFLGIGGIVSTLGQMEIIENVQILAGKSTLEKVHELIHKVVFRGARMPMQIDLIEIKPGVVFGGDDFDIVAFPVRHRGPDCFGFLFQEHSRRPFLNDKASALGVPNGPERKYLVEGKAITLADGRTILPQDVMGDVQRGVKLVMTGDLGETNSIAKLCVGADTIVAEATYLEEDGDLARNNGHITARTAAMLARDVGARQLILNHISGRHTERDILAEATAVFQNTCIARDFDEFVVARAA